MSHTRTKPQRVSGKVRLRKPPKYAPRLARRLHLAVMIANLWEAPRRGDSRQISFIQKKGIGVSSKTFVSNILGTLSHGDLVVSSVAVYHDTDYWRAELTTRPRPPGQELLSYAEKALGEDL